LPTQKSTSGGSSESDVNELAVIALIEPGTPALVLAPRDETYDDVMSGALQMKARGAMIIGVVASGVSIRAALVGTAALLGLALPLFARALGQAPVAPPGIVSIPVLASQSSGGNGSV